MDILSSSFIPLLGLFLPSLFGLAILNWQLFYLVRQAQREESPAAKFLLAILVIFVGVIISWVIVLADAYALLEAGYKLFDWRVSFLPVGWAIISLGISRLLASDLL